MKTMRRRMALVSLSMTAALFATSVAARSWQAKTMAGQKVAAHNYCAGLNRKTCTETAVPQIKVTVPPSGGTVSFESAMITNVFTRVGEERVGKQCPTVPRHCIEIDYTPASGYRGTDHFSYTVSNPDGQVWNDTLTIVVN